MSGLRRAADRLGEQAEQAVLAGRKDLVGQALARRTALLAQVFRLGEQQDMLRAEEQKMADAGRRLQEQMPTRRFMPSGSRTSTSWTG